MFGYRKDSFSSQKTCSVFRQCKLMCSTSVRPGRPMSEAWTTLTGHDVLRLLGEPPRLISGFSPEAPSNFLFFQWLSSIQVAMKDSVDEDVSAIHDSDHKLVDVECMLITRLRSAQLGTGSSHQRTQLPYSAFIQYCLSYSTPDCPRSCLPRMTT